MASQEASLVGKGQSSSQSDQATIKQDFPSMLNSELIKIEAGVGDTKTYFIHISVLCAESEMYRAQLRGSGTWKEKTEGKISTEEIPEIFDSFVNYIYRKSLPKAETEGDAYLVHLARLYCLGDRLMARNFQEAVFRRFTEKLDILDPISLDALCELLEVAFAELPEKRKNDDQLQSAIGPLAAFRFPELWKHPPFRDELSREHPGMMRPICFSLAKMVGVEYAMWEFEGEERKRREEEKKNGIHWL
ncbi:hypothetical protein IWZ00DRAFT_542252 [Phyllosticta capitalensis]|uniref:BTB domain-containing protein n=1 Tax=Phyllosticta capitalensis TaxID=121624 RepID=A0ABR1YXX2_9PEZI